MFHDLVVLIVNSWFTVDAETYGLATSKAIIRGRRYLYTILCNYCLPFLV